MKKAVYLVLALVLVLSLTMAACSNNAAPPPADTGSSSTAETPAATPSDDGLKKVGLIVCHMTDEWTVGSYTLMQEEAASRGYEIVMFADSEWDLKKEAESLDTLLPMDLDMLVIQPVDENATGTNVQPFIDKGVPVLSIGITLINDGKAGFVGWDTFGSGYMIGEDCVTYIKDELDGKANVAILSFPVENTLNRQAGFEAALNDSGFDINYVSDQNFEGSRETAVVIIENIIQAGTEFDVVWAAFTSGGLGARTALEAANSNAKVWCCGGYGEELFDIFISQDPWYMADYVVFPRVYVDTIFGAMDEWFVYEKPLGDVYSPFPVMNQKNYKELLGI